jgi:hypothetical protein
MAEPNEAIPLYSGPITLQDKQGAATGEGRIELRWQPDMEIGFTIPSMPLPASGGPCVDLVGADVRMVIPEAMSPATVMVTHEKISSHQPCAVWGMLNGPLEIGRHVPLTALELCLANFCYFLPPHFYCTGSGMTRIDPIRWEIDDWVITITAVPEVSQLVEKLKVVGGYVLTHRVRIEKAGSACFSVEDAETITDRLFQFLCFAQGRCVNLILPVGYDASGNTVWRKWASWHVSRWNPSETWVDEHHANRIVGAFKGFLQQCQNADWKETIDLVLYWYVESSQAFSLNTGIVLAQIAMERLVWEYFVRQGKLSKQQYKALGSAAARVSALAKDLGIPVPIPAHYQEMVGMRCPDLVSAIVSVRNDIAHPEPRVSPNPKLLLETRNCSVWLLEMLLLRLFDYHGPYSDRREPNKFVGQVSAVPWK